MCTTPTCFRAFYRCAMVPTIVENSKSFVHLFVNIFCKYLLWLVNPHIPHMKWQCAQAISIIVIFIMLHCQLCSACYTALWIKNCSKSTSAYHTYQKKWHHTPQLYQLLSEKWRIHYASVLAMFNPLYSNTNRELFEKHLCNQSSHYEKYGWFPFRREAYHVLPLNRHFSLSAKMNGTQRRTLVSPWRMHFMYCSIPKGTSQDEAMLNSEKIKPVAVVIIELHLSEGISQLLTDALQNFFKNSMATCWKCFGSNWNLFWA